MPIGSRDTPTFNYFTLDASMGGRCHFEII